ncbi:insulinase family protein [Termitidicoccus mucosus]|uniref:Peptidase M16 n=1 Tax=Termitidicoccus mucosus TaxID=1184151 RepID=A0A178ICG8_9BACT|nr:peptidase M16 [Opitutaceae bacterium TSB47]
MQKPIRLAALAVAALHFVLFSGAPARAVTPPTGPKFAHDTSDLRADSRVRFGTLPNGLRYVVLANSEPKDRASLRLAVVAGSLQETDAERGIAHYLEHMAFNGSTHYEPGTLVNFFQRMGMGFGNDTNAYTSFDRTVYLLELPDTKAPTLTEGLTVLNDYAGGLLLLQQQVDKERGIILAEKRTRDSIDYRQRLAEYNFVLGDTLLPHRFPIGETETIESFQREHFTAFYDAWYRPERMAVIAVGDFDPAAVAGQIAGTFSTLAARAPARPDPGLGSIPAFAGTRAAYLPEAEAPAASVSIQSIVAIQPESDTVATRLEKLPRTVALAIVNRRLSILAKKENAPFSRGVVYASEGFDLFRNAGIDLTCQPAQWPEALALGEQELRRALEHGFDDAELREATANILNSLEQAVRTAATRRSDSLASGLISALVNDRVFTTPDDDLALFKPALEKITAAECLAALRAAFDAPGRYLTVMGNAVVGPDLASGREPASPADIITAAYEKSRATPVAAPEAVADAAFAYTGFGPAGEIASSEHVADLDLDLATFTNGVHLNTKKTDFEAGRIYINVRVGTGQLTEPRDQPGLATYINSTFLAGGLGKHSADDLQRILAGRTVGTGFSVADDALVFSARTNRDDLLLQLQLIAAHITDPGYREESDRQARKAFEQFYTRLRHVPNGPLQLEMPRLLASGDPRFGVPAQAELAARTLAEARAWLAPQFATGPIEIAIVGDLDPAAARDAVARTLGALPPRDAKPELEAERRAAFPEKPFTRNFTVETEIPKGILALYWPTTDSRDVGVARRLSLLTAVFRDRLRVQVREKLGDTYSPSAGSMPSDTYRDYGVLVSNVTLDPAKVEIVGQTIAAIADDLAQNGVTEEELERARLPILTSLRESARTNAYWLGSVLGAAQEQPERLAWSRTRYTDFEGITKAELDAFAKKYLPSERAFRAIVTPAAK